MKQHIESADQAELTARETELKDIELALADLDSQFTQDIGFMRRGVLNEQGFVRANNLAREQVSALQEQRETLVQWVNQQTEREETSERVPSMVKTFIEDFQTLEPRVRESHLQTILKSAHVRRNSIELEFRT